MAGVRRHRCLRSERLTHSIQEIVLSCLRVLRMSYSMPRASFDVCPLLPSCCKWHKGMSSVLECFVSPPVNTDRNARTLTEARGQLIFELSVKFGRKQKSSVEKWKGLNMLVNRTRRSPGRRQAGPEWGVHGPPCPCTAPHVQSAACGAPCCTQLSTAPFAFLCPSRHVGRLPRCR